MHFKNRKSDPPQFPIVTVQKAVRWRPRHGGTDPG